MTEIMNERVLVAGAGALGSVLGGFLAAAGHDVTLLGRAPHMDAIVAGPTPSIRRREEQTS